MFSYRLFIEDKSDSSFKTYFVYVIREKKNKILWFMKTKPSTGIFLPLFVRLQSLVIVMDFFFSFQNSSGITQHRGPLAVLPLFLECKELFKVFRVSRLIQCSLENIETQEALFNRSLNFEILGRSGKFPGFLCTWRIFL